MGPRGPSSASPPAPDAAAGETSPEALALVARSKQSSSRSPTGQARGLCNQIDAQGGKGAMDRPTHEAFGSFRLTGSTRVGRASLKERTARVDRPANDASIIPYLRSLAMFLLPPQPPRRANLHVTDPPCDPPTPTPPPHRSGSVGFLERKPPSAAPADTPASGVSKRVVWYVRWGKEEMGEWARQAGLGPLGTAACACRPVDVGGTSGLDERTTYTWTEFASTPDLGRVYPCNP